MDDLLDLYAAHELSLQNDPEELLNLKDENGIKSSEKKKTVKYVPWEPYKAAPSHDRKGCAPLELPPLISYTKREVETSMDINSNNMKILIDARKYKNNNGNTVPHDYVGSADETVLKLNESLQKMEKELDMERKMNCELRQMFLSSLGDELQTQVEALAGDKIELARRLDEYCHKLAARYEEMDELRIQCDLWRCKFLAQSIRVEEINKTNHKLINILKKAHEWANRNSTLTDCPELNSFSQSSLQSFLGRSPCEEPISSPVPLYSNITVTCCKNCCGKEIILL